MHQDLTLLGKYLLVVHQKHGNHCMGKKAFTLIELVIVISIISLLAIMGISSYGSIQQNARNAKRKSDLKEIQKALESFKARNGFYPVTTSSPGHPSGHKWYAQCNYNDAPNAVVGNMAGDNMIPGLAPVFIPKIPTDPRNSTVNPQRSAGCSSGDCGGCANANHNCYKYVSNGTDYKLVAHCTPEGTLTSDDPFYDPQRYQSANGGVRWAWQVSSSNATANW